MENLVDGIIQECVEELWEEWKLDPLYDQAEVKLILAPAHGTNKDECKGRLLWSNGGRDAVKGLPRTLENALEIAYEVGFRSVVLQYCYSGTFLKQLPSTMEADMAIQAATYSELGSLNVVGFDGIEWTVDAEIGSTAAYSYLARGAQVTSLVKNVPSHLLVFARINMLQPGESLGRYPLSTLKPVAVASKLRYVGGGKIRDPEDSNPLYNRQPMKKRRKARKERKKKSDDNCLQGPSLEAGEVLAILQRRRVNGLFRVRYTDTRNNTSRVKRGRIVEKLNDYVKVRFIQENGIEREGTIPMKNRKFIVTP